MFNVQSFRVLGSNVQMFKMKRYLDFRIFCATLNFSRTCQEIRREQGFQVSGFKWFIIHYLIFDVRYSKVYWNLVFGIWILELGICLPSAAGYQEFT